MSGPAELAIAAGVLADAGLKATAVLGLGWVVARALRHHSAALRHAAWTAAFAALPLLPWLSAARGPEVAIDAPWLVAVWGLGAACAGLPVVLGLLRLRRLQSLAIPDPTAPNVLHSDQVGGPLTWGLLQPVVVLPACAQAWPPSHRAAALAHEDAHIQRRDWGVHLAVWAVSALFWFNPLVWLARQELAREAEHAADDAVLAQGVRPSEYAALLVSLARSGGPVAALGTGSTAVGARVRAILAPRVRSPRRWPVWVAALLVALLALPALAAWPVWVAPQAAQTCEVAPWAL